jgi:hypothetical protein
MASHLSREAQEYVPVMLNNQSLLVVTMLSIRATRFVALSMRICIAITYGAAALVTMYSVKAAHWRMS